MSREYGAASHDLVNFCLFICLFWGENYLLIELINAAKYNIILAYVKASPQRHEAPERKTPG